MKNLIYISAALVILCSMMVNVGISGAQVIVDMGTLIEGDGDQDHAVGGTDFTILRDNWLGFDERVDFDRDGVCGGTDFTLMRDAWLMTSPQEI